ncbi:hypothetical protein [Streptomyces sp. Wb2n-11]|uniref:hypothetical protein n=1 Tax=Streptomyces sp. Wb2n-11 TaxID=1030533 RepID=UPI000AB6A2F4|nr:hypothetical protein [Streptomyces sp. Wb2n-11]
MTLARFLACLLGPPREVPMARLLDLDQGEFNRRVRAVRDTGAISTQRGVVPCAVCTRQSKEADAR